MNQDIFIPTQNYQRFESLVSELLSSSVGVEMAAVYGRAGRGKTTSAQRIVAQDARTAYVRYEEWMRDGHVGLIREIAFRVSGMRPGTTAACVRLIKEELGRTRKILLVDEADRLNLRHLNALRDLHDSCHVPIMMIGEDPLRANLARESRLISRTRAELGFEPVGQTDLSIYYKKALGLDIAKEMAVRLLKHSGGDFRRVVKDALTVERIMKASGHNTLNDQVVDEICKV